MRLYVHTQAPEHTKAWSIHHVDSCCVKTTRSVLNSTYILLMTAILRPPVSRCRDDISDRSIEVAILLAHKTKLVRQGSASFCALYMHGQGKNALR
jgi:hypothetical protein